MMQWELDQRTFKRLVQLYLLAYVASIGALVYEVLNPTWNNFGEAFEFLVDEHFGTRPEAMEPVSIAVGLAALVWHFGSAIGLLWFKRWARFGIWASLLLFLGGEILQLTVRPIFTSPWSGWLETIGPALLGAIVLLAYSRDHGRLWFMTPLDKLKETF